MFLRGCYEFLFVKYCEGINFKYLLVNIVIN